jgi:probable HAF family extracellular repeat protein
MRFFSWLRPLTCGVTPGAGALRLALARQTAPRKPGRARLHLEQLEERWCPSSYAITDLGTLGGANSNATAINSAVNGHPVQVVGSANTAAGAEHAFLWTPGATNGVPSNPQMQDLGTLPGFPNSEALALNNTGQVAGEVSDAGYSNHDAFYWNGTAMQDLGTLGGTYTIAWALNNAVSGIHPVQVVGESWTGAPSPNGSGVDHAFVWQNGAMTDLNDPNLYPAVANNGWVFKFAKGINDSEQIVGFGTLNGQPHGFLWTLGSGAPIDLGPYCNPSAVNQIGQVVGLRGGDAFLWTNGTLSILPLVKGTSPNPHRALGLNNASQLQVVGYWTDYATGTLYDHAVLWNNGTAIDLTGQINRGVFSRLQRAWAVNDAGMIVGGGYLNSGAVRAFLMTPSPHGGALTAAALPSTAVTQTLRNDQVAPLLTEALARWQAADVDTSVLGTIQIQIANLGGCTLGLADEMHHTIWLDDNAAGRGWFIDKTPWDDSEFTTPGDQGERNHMDPLTVLEHELGHVLGFEHAKTGVMTDTLPAGTRRTPQSEARLTDPPHVDEASPATAWRRLHPTGRRSPR